MFARLIRQMEQDGKLEGAFLQMINTYRVKEFQCSKIPWLPPPPQNANPDDYPRAQCFDNMKAILFQAVCASVPKYLAPNYHTVNVAELVNNSGSEWNYATLSSMYMMDTEVFGISLMKTINRELHNNEKSRRLKKKGHFDGRRVLILVLTLQTTYGGVLVKNVLDSDYCTSAKEFLLQPCILIQLPWKPVVLQQWLLGALAEVLLFEKESLELRHWPLPADLIDCATQVLALVRDLKSRIVLGFAILGRMVHTYPESNPNLHQCVLEEVVLPSVPILDFVMYGWAHHFIKNIKKLAWTEDSVGESKTFVDSSSYMMNTQLEQFSATSFYCYFLWSQSPMPKIFTNPEFDIHEMASKITNPGSPLKNVKTSKNSLSFEENKLLELLEKYQYSGKLCMTRQEKLHSTFQFIADNVILQEKLPGLTAPMLMHIFMSPKNNRLADQIYDLSKTDPIILAIRHVFMSKMAGICASEIHQLDDNAVASVICLQLECLEREQEVRLSFACSEIFKLKLHLNNVQTGITSNSESLLQSLFEVKQQIIENDQMSLIDRLPTEWKKDVFKHEVCVGYEMSTPNASASNVVAISNQFQIRICRLMANITKTNSIAMATEGGEMFPYLSVVQYVLPLFVAAVTEHETHFGAVLFHKHTISHNLYGPEACKALTVHLNVINLAHTIIKHYENLFYQWCEQKYKLPACHPALGFDEKLKDPTYYKSYSLIILKYREIIRYLLMAHTDETLGNYTSSTLMCYDQILNFICNWTLMVAHIILDGGVHAIEPAMSVVDAWFKLTFNFLMDLFQICESVFKHPEAGKVCPKYPELGELYFATVVLIELQVVFEIAAVDGKIRDLDCVNRSKAMLSVPQVDNHLNVYRAIVDIQTKGVSDIRITQVMTEGKESMLQLYNWLKEFRQESGCIIKYSLYHMLPNRNNPEVRKAVQYYINGNLDALDRMLTIFKIPYVKKCRQCGTTTGELRACDKCVKQNFPDVNYFCSKKCRDARWKAEHMEQHRDFEADLLDQPEEDATPSTSQGASSMSMTDLAMGMKEMHF